MTAPLPLPIPPLLLPAGDPSSAGKPLSGDGGESITAGDPLTGLAFQPLLQQILLMPAGQDLPSPQTGSQGIVFLPAGDTRSGTAQAGGQAISPGAEDGMAALGLTAQAGKGALADGASGMSLTATLPGLTHPAAAIEGAASSLPGLEGVVPQTAVPALEGDAAAALLRQSPAPVPAGGKEMLSPQTAAPLSAMQLAAGAAPQGPGSLEAGGEEGTAAGPAFQARQSRPAGAADRPVGQNTPGMAGRPPADSPLLHAAAGDGRQAGAGQASAPSQGEHLFTDPRQETGAAPLASTSSRAEMPQAASFPVGHKEIRLAKADGGRMPSTPVGAVERHAPPAAAATLTGPVAAGITNLMQPAEPGLRLPLAEEGRMPPGLRKGKGIAAGKPPRLAGMTPPSPLPRPEQIGKIALPRQGGQSPLADGASGLIGRESGGPTFPPAADASRLAPLSLPASASGTEHGRGDSPALLATPPAAAPSQPLTIRHPLAPTPFLPASARPADLAQGAGAGDGLAPSSAHPAAPLSLSSLDGAGGGPARALTNPQQPMAGQQQAQAATQLGLALQYRIGRQETKFALRLDPPELGRVEVSLKLHEGGRVDALIRTEHSHTLDLLQRDVRVLERAFHQLGLKPEGGIQFASGQQGHGHSGSAFSQAQQDGMGQPHAGGGHGDGGRENPTGDMTPQSASGEGREMGMPDEGSRERPVMAARVGVDVKV